MLYRRFSDKVDFKNVQRRVYDALNVLSAMDIIRKHKNTIIYNEGNQFIDDRVQPNTAPEESVFTTAKKSQSHVKAPSVTEHSSTISYPRSEPASKKSERLIRDNVFRQHHLDEQKKRLEKKRELKRELKLKLKNLKKLKGEQADHIERLRIANNNQY